MRNNKLMKMLGKNKKNQRKLYVNRINSLHNKLHLELMIVIIMTNICIKINSHSNCKRDHKLDQDHLHLSNTQETHLEENLLLLSDFLIFKLIFIFILHTTEL